MLFDFDRNTKIWEEAMIKKGHTPIYYENRLDIFVCDYGLHNVPGCSICRWSCCMHCEEIEKIPECENKRFRSVMV